MIKYFSKNEPLVLVFIPLLVGAHLTLDYFFPSYGTLIGGSENGWNINFYLLDRAISVPLAFLFVCVNAILINFVFNRLEFYDSLVFLPSLIYIMIIFLFPFSLRLSEDLIGHFFFILSFYQLLTIRQNEEARNNTFLSGLFLGFATTFLPSYFVFVFVIWVGLFAIRPFVLREHILPLIGLLLPFMWVYLVDPLFLDKILQFDSVIEFHRYPIPVLLIPLIVLVLLVLIGFVKVFDNRRMSSVRFKKMTFVILFSVLFSIAYGILMHIWQDTFFYLTITIVYLPFILPYAFLGSRKKWIPYSLFYILIVLNCVKFFFVPV